MYESAARVSEIAALCVGNVRFHKEGATVNLSGKSKNPREVPIDLNISNFLKSYLAEETLYRSCLKTSPFFCNRVKEKLTRAGVAYILDKYVNEARLSAPDLIPERVSPHIFRQYGERDKVVREGNR
jgi:site-specific recombinase XerD